jgi:hypothetical protein
LEEVKAVVPVKVPVRDRETRAKFFLLHDAELQAIFVSERLRSGGASLLA